MKTKLMLIVEGTFEDSYPLKISRAFIFFRTTSRILVVSFLQGKGEKKDCGVFALNFKVNQL